MSDHGGFVFHALVFSYATETTMFFWAEDTFWSFCDLYVCGVVSSSLWSSCGTVISTSGFTANANATATATTTATATDTDTDTDTAT